jgi:F420-dependent oxidoreductase-like protein
MDLRIFIEPQQGASYDDQLRIVRAAEDLGFDGLFRSDHYLKMGDVSGLPGPSDAWVAIAGLARDTSRIRLGTLVSPATFRLPGPLAITVAQTDAMSGGRVELGLGAGWFDDEHRAYGIPFPDMPERFDRFGEYVEIVAGLLSTPADARYTFEGKHYRLLDSPALPKPVQRPRPPIILGGDGKPRGARLAARFADEFNTGFKPLAGSGESIARVRAAADEAGRTLVYSLAGDLCVGRSDAEVAARADVIGRTVEAMQRNGFAGSPAQVVDKLGQAAELGVTRVYLRAWDLDDLDHLELAATEVMPQVMPQV